MRVIVEKLRRTGSLIAIMLFILAFLAPKEGWAETETWRKELKKDVVEVSKDKMTITEYQVCRIGDSSIQVKTYSEASSGFMSRDNFIAFTAVYSTLIAQNLGEMECKDIGAPIGSADVEILLYMTKDGIKIETQDHSTDTKQSQTLLWSAIFDEE